ncbi:hypothetical protein ACWNT8_07385 [Pigmentibacter ruber]|uniref:hypothetical protein n=1 Tax=Pigmentibacter ruber TaxID=2683196 RepID=UPI00131B7B06|nr:hypothetical protein [Pigmentibacter ruber]BFD32909.1 hypothetical protein GTC16762_25270 [Pigmentibacter ruber]
MVDKKEENKIPENIKNKIMELKLIETQLGHIPPENWNVGDLYAKYDNSNYHQSLTQLEKQTEILFLEICEALEKLNFSYISIAKEINAIVNYVGGPKYCNEEEVKQVLGK